jgi:hypothetical protein
MGNDNDLGEVNRKLDMLIKLLAYQTVGKMTLTEGAPLLRRLGFTPTEIAAIYGSNAKVVSVRLAEAKKKMKKG